ncbi:MAG: hypothetical protein IJI37_06295, partial [Opitutales bacterium]|nr:hypothetical protein [Opitutales bacterium]
VGVWDSEALDYISLQTTRADRYFIGVVFLPNGTVKIVANDSASTPASLTFSTSDASFGVESEYATGEFSRLAVFDFDILDANAPYTFADYRAGKDIPFSIRGRYAYSTDPTMGASTSAWNITTPPEEYANVRNGDWTAGPSVVYLKNRTSDLPDGETYAIDYAANGAVYDIMNDTFLENLYSKLIYDTGAKKYRVKFKYKWNKLASVHDDVFFGVYLMMSWVDQIELLRINSPDTPDGQWHEYDQVIDVNDYMGLNVPALFVSPTSSPNYGDYAISLAGFSITSASDALFISADALSGNQIRDISGNNNHLNKNTSYDEHLNAFSAEKDLNPAAASFDIVSLDLTKTAGEPIGGNSSVVPARGGKLCTLNLRSDKAATFKIGTATTTAKYGTLTFSAANTWQTLRFTSYGDDQVYITRNAAGTGKATFIATINYEDIIG